MNGSNDFELPAVAGSNSPQVGGAMPNNSGSNMGNAIPGAQDMPQPAQYNNMNNSMPALNNGMPNISNSMGVNNNMSMPAMNGMNNTNQPSMYNNMMNSQGMGSGSNGVNDIVNKVKGMDKKVIVAGVAAMLIVFLLILIILFSGGSKGAAKKLSKYYVNGNYKKMAELYHEDFADSYSEDFEKVLKEDFDDREDEDVKYKSYRIIDKFTYSKDKLDDLKKLVEKTYNIDRDDIKGAVQYLVKFKIDDDGDSVVDYQIVLTIKVNNKWYVFSMPSSSYY